MPGVTAAALSTGNPARGDWIELATSAERTEPESGVAANLRFVTPGFFESLGVPMAVGRALVARDETGPPAVVVSRSLARRLWGDERGALGRTLWVAEAPARSDEWTVVGVSRDAREESPVQPAVYLPYAHHMGRFPAQEVDLFVRAAAGDL